MIVLTMKRGDIHMNWTVVIEMLIAMIVVPLLITGTTSVMSMFAKQITADDFSSRFLVGIGWLGIVLHELGHAVMALIFRHKIMGIKLVQIHDIEDSDSLGYVNLAGNRHSFYQKLGNFFIGIAPFLSCSGFLYGIHYLLLGTRHNFYVARASSNWLSVLSIMKASWSNIGMNITDDLHYPLRGLVFLILVVMVSLSGFAISSNDWRYTARGLKDYIIASFIVALSVTIMGWFDASSIEMTWKFLAGLLFLMFNSWLYTLFSLAIVVLLKYTIVHRHAIGYAKPHMSLANSVMNVFSKPKGRHFR